MPKKNSPRHGSLGVWPRKRAKRSFPRVRSWPTIEENKPLGFAGYKVGMTHVQVLDQGRNSPTRNEIVAVPVTIIECPALKVAGVRCYKTDAYGQKAFADISEPKDLDKVSEVDRVMLFVETQPHSVKLKKKSEMFEVALGGTAEEQLAFAKEHLGQELKVQDIFEENQLVDVKAVTKGKGFQGPVKRFGVGLRQHKSEKTRRGPGSLGPWKNQGGIMWRVAHAGQTGYHTRTDYNKQILKIGDNGDDVNPEGGFKHYGPVQGSYVLVKGSVPGPAKRLIRFNWAIRPGEPDQYQVQRIHGGKQ